MMFAHISDTHLGQTQYGLAEREEDMYTAFDEAVDTSLRDHADFVVLSGDLFDKPVPGGRAMLKMADALKRLDAAGTRAYFVLGEHDISRVRATPVSYVYHNLGVARYIGDGEPVEHDNVMLVGFDKMRRDELRLGAGRLAAAGARAASHAGRSVLVMHQAIAEANSFAAELASGDLPRGFEYYCMGHLHDRYERRFEGLGGLLAYPGSTEVTSVEGIRAAEKGFYEVDLSGAEASASWVALDTRPHLVFGAEYDMLEQEAAGMLDAITGCGKRPVVRVDVSGRLVDAASVQARLARVADAALYCDWKINSREPSSSVLPRRPAAMHEEMRRLSAEALDDEELAAFVNDELYPLLSAGRLDEAVEAVMADYKRYAARGISP